MPVCVRFLTKGDMTMAQALKARDDMDEHTAHEQEQSGAVIDAFDHVLAALDEIMALTKDAFPETPGLTRH
jgi:hypothetical protein